MNPVRGVERGLPPFAVRVALILATIAVLLLVPDARAHGGHHRHHGHGHAHVAYAPDETALGLQWYDLTRDAVRVSGQPEQVTQNRIWAVSWIAAARAVDQRNPATFNVPAFATALHDTLVGLAPAAAPQLDAALASTLAGVPGGSAKAQGIAAGQHEAARSLAERAGDGLETAAQVDPPWTPPAAAPGIWQPTPPAFGPAVRAGTPSARSFLLHSNDEFRAPPPPSLTSWRYLRSLAEVHAVGSATSSTRTPAQTDVANFIAQPSVDFYAQVVRAAIADGHRSLAWQTRLVAAFNAIEIDQQIAIYDAKYTYVRWRPVTAIRTGTVDPDPTWTPLLNTPSHPEYPSGHAGYAGTAEAVLSALVGPAPSRPIATTSATAPGQVRTYSQWSTLTQETVDGRVWEGVHFRFSDETAARVGRAVAWHDLRRLWKLGI
jgi:hypothetical protein